MTVGRASDVLICDVQKMLTQIQETVGFEYIKLCGIFSDDLHIYNETASKVPVYSFSYLDKILDFVYRQSPKTLASIILHAGKTCKISKQTIVWCKCQPAPLCQCMVSAGP